MNSATKLNPHNNTSSTQLGARENLFKLFDSRPFSDEQLLTNFGLFARASALAKIFFLHEAYQLIKPIPGDIYVFGVWLGQDMVLLESMRAMLEPYNASRTLVGFDTFAGYQGISEKDSVSDVIKPAGYDVPGAYAQYLEELLAYHRSENAMGHAVRHRLVVGDIGTTAMNYVQEHTESIIALAYIDLALYEPTLAALKAIESRLIPGSVIAFDELNDPRYPGETQAFREWIGQRSYEIVGSTVLPDRTFVIVK
jgi:hypothetical protein